MVTNTLGVLQRENARLQVENHNLQDEINQLRAFIEVLKTLTAADADFSSDEALLPLLWTTFSMVMDLLQAPEGSLLLLDEETHELQFVLVKGALAENLRGYRIPANEGIAGWVLQHRRPTLVRDVRHDRRFSDSIDEEFKFRTQSIAAAPIIGGGNVFGVLEALNQPIDVPFSDLDMTLMNLVCRFVGELLNNVEREQPSDKP
jgi:GAF domain-containing protein